MPQPAPSASRRLLRGAGVVLAGLLIALTAACDAPAGQNVNESRIPKPAAGFKTSRIRAATYTKHRSDGVGAMRTNCSLSHMNYDDPIVFPGKLRVTHLHAFFGNTRTNGNSTPTSIRTTGDSTCTGGTANRSSYWAPAMIDTVTKTPITPWGDNGLQVYYKSGYRGVDTNSIVNFPTGLRMIAGTATSTAPQSGIVSYHCDIAGTASTPGFQQCRPGDRLVMSIEFPQCWDGRNLDSANHKSHMAYGTWGVGCPSSHPVALPQITQNFRYTVPAGGMANWRLATDMYTSGPGGYSGHADWVNGWDRAVFQRVIDNCFKGGYDCSMNLLGDGQMLY